MPNPQEKPPINQPPESKPAVESEPKTFDKKKTVVFAEVKEIVKKAAYDAGEARMTEDRENLKGIGGFFKRIWKHNVMKEYYEQREKSKAEKKIRAEKSILAGEYADPQLKEHNAEMQAVCQRFTQEHEAKWSDEGKEQIQDSQLKKEVLSSINDFAKDGDESKLNSGLDSILDKIARTQGIAPIILKDNVDYVNNLKKIAEETRQSYQEAQELGRASEAVLEDIDLVWAKARGAVRTEAQLSGLDRVIEKVENIKGIGPFINPAVLTGLIAGTYCAGRKIMQAGIRNKVIWGVTFGLSALGIGAMEYAKESKTLKKEKAQHARDKARGKKFEGKDKAPRRAEMEQYAYEAIEVQKEIQGLKSFYGVYGDYGKGRALKDLSTQEQQALVDNISDLEARIKIMDEKRIDLMSYSDAKKVEQERTELLCLRANIKKDFQEKYGDSLTGQLNDLIGGKAQAIERDLERGISAKDVDFNSMRRKRALKKGAIAVGGGLITGLVAQEVSSFFIDKQAGVFEHATGAEGEHLTAIARIKDLIKGEGTDAVTGVHPAAEHVQNILIDGKLFEIKLPEGAGLVSPKGDGVYSLMQNNKEVCGGLAFDKNGVLTEASHKALEAKGIITSETSKTITDVLPGTGASAQARQEFIQKHPDLFSRIKRALWYDNNTPKPIFDKNELKLWWGGENNCGMDKAGNFVFNMEHMTPGGSYHTPFSVDAQQAMKAGKLKMLLSLSRDSQNNVFEVQIDEYGNAIIPKDSEAAKVFFEQANGKAVFKGKFAEVSQMMGEKTSDGREIVKVLATHVGQENVQIPIEKIVPITEFNIPPALPAALPWDLPPIIPIPGARYPLEKATKPDIAPLPVALPYHYSYGYYERDLIKRREREEFFRERFSEKLRNNPKAILSFDDEAKNYLERNKNINPHYVNEMSETVGQIETQEKMDDKCRVAICIPAYDLGEGKVAEHALDLYRKQIENGSVKSEEFEIVLFLNHPKDKLAKMQIKDGAEERVKNGIPEAYDTEEVVKQYKAKYPELKIRVIKKEFDKRPPWGQIIKYNYDVALIRAIERSNPEVRDIILATNDIDVRDMTDTYIRDIIDIFDKNEKDFVKNNKEKIDACVGRIDYGQEVYQKWPNFFVATRFEQLLGSQLRQGYGSGNNKQIGKQASSDYLGGTKEKSVRTSGDNTAMKGSIYCAIGGPNIESDCGADTELGDMINVARRTDESKKPKVIIYKNRLWRDTDPRRQIETYKEGKPVVHAWGNWAGMTVYGKSFEEQIDGEEEKLNAKRLEFEFNAAIGVYWVPVDSKVVKRSLHWLGFKDKDYTIEDGKIKILELKNVQTRVDRWKPKRELWKTAKGRNPIRTKSLYKT